MIADLVTVVILAPIAVSLDWHASQPILILALMLAGLCLNRLFPLLSERTLRRERDQLFAAQAEAATEDDQGLRP